MSASAVRSTLKLAVAAFTPEGRRDPSAMALGWRITKLGAPLPDGFVEITETEMQTHYLARLRPEGHRAASLDGIVMTDEEASRLYCERIRRA